jgi:hypothetical protein
VREDNVVAFLLVKGRQLKFDFDFDFDGVVRQQDNFLGSNHHIGEVRVSIFYKQLQVVWVFELDDLAGSPTRSHSSSSKL